MTRCFISLHFVSSRSVPYLSLISPFFVVRAYSPVTWSSVVQSLDVLPPFFDSSTHHPPQFDHSPAHLPFFDLSMHIVPSRAFGCSISGPQTLALLFQALLSDFRGIRPVFRLSSFHLPTSRSPTTESASEASQQFMLFVSDEGLNRKKPHDLRVHNPDTLS